MKVYIDGGSRGNPGSSAVGFTVFDDKKKEVFRYGKNIGHCTNNFAEYMALIEVLKYIYSHQFHDKNEKSIVIYSDSELLVKQMNRDYKVKSKNIYPLYMKAQELVNGLNNIRIEHVKREDNRIADWIVNRVLDGESFELA